MLHALRAKNFPLNKDASLLTCNPERTLSKATVVHIYNNSHHSLVPSEGLLRKFPTILFPTTVMKVHRVVEVHC